MFLHVLQSVGRPLLVDGFTSADSVATVKNKIQVKTGIPMRRQILKHDGRLLEDGRTLSSYAWLLSGEQVDLTVEKPAAKK